MLLNHVESSQTSSSLTDALVFPDDDDDDFAETGILKRAKTTSSTSRTSTDLQY